MRKLLKKISCCVVAVLLILSTLSFSACSDYKTLNVKINANGTEYQMKVLLYDYLTPKTSEKMLADFENGYYNDTLIYQSTAYSNQLFMGNLKVGEGDAIVQNENKNFFEGEFEKNGVVYKNKDKVEFPLSNKNGAIGLWRTWSAIDNGDNSYKTTGSFNKASNTMYLLTDTNSNYDGYFCVFALLDLEDENTATALAELKSVFASSDKYTMYYSFYTGEYSTENHSELDNFGLTYHCVSSEDFVKGTEEDSKKFNGETIFVAKGDQYVAYNQQVLKISTTTKIVSITVE